MLALHAYIAFKKLFFPPNPEDVGKVEYPSDVLMDLFLQAEIPAKK